MCLRSLHRYILSILLTIAWAGVSYAQVDLYDRINDPNALARLNNPDREPLQYVNLHGWTSQIDPIDSAHLLASDTGAGVITHMWMTYGGGDSATRLRIWIDDKLICDGPISAALCKTPNWFLAPLDTLYPGATVADVQIPYRKNFRITIAAPDWNVYSAIAWRHVRDSNLVPAFAKTPPYPQLYRRSIAEQRVTQVPDPWKDSMSLLSVFADTLRPGRIDTVFDLSGSATVRSLNLILDRYDAATLDSMWVNFYWDNNPTPAVHVPLGDFFATVPGSTPVRAINIQWDETNGFRWYYPMPFAHHGTMTIENRGSVPCFARQSTKFRFEQIDRRVMGYFYAIFSETMLTRFHVNHQIAHVKGAGRYLGMFMYTPSPRSGVSLEGDPIFTIDSSKQASFEYTGGEDYFDGGWWFLGQMFSKPFAGHTKFLESFYRFHVLDAVDFHSSFDLEMQHGIRSDNYEHFRTTAYMYKLTIPFWTARDTIRAGEQWSVSGSGYKPNEQIVARFDTTVIFTTNANASGDFTAILTVPALWPAGVHPLSINGEMRPEPVYVLALPSIRPIADFLPPVVRYRDTLLVTGAGFDPGEPITLYLDSIPVSDPAVPIIVGNDYRFYGSMKIPSIKDWTYHIVARGSNGNAAIASDEATVIRTLPYEFEDLIPYASWTKGTCDWLNYGLNWYTAWSKQCVADFDPGAIGGSITFKFYVPVSDTFDVRMWLTNGKAFGDYDYSVDGKRLGTFRGYTFIDPPWFDPKASDTMRLGIIYFAKDTHTVTFRCVGRDTAATDFHLGADVMTLTPTTVMALPPGVWHNIAPGDSNKGTNGIDVVHDPRSIPLYPNPVSGGDLKLDFFALDSTLYAGTASIVVSDVLGRVVLSTRVVWSEIPPTANIPVDGLPSGRYRITATITTATGLRDFTASFIVFK